MNLVKFPHCFRYALGLVRDLHVPPGKAVVISWEKFQRGPPVNDYRHLFE